MQAQSSPALAEEQVILIAQNALARQSTPYDVDFGLHPWWQSIRTDVIGKEGRELSVWSVNYLTPAGVFDQESRFVEIDDATGQALGIVTAHNYFFL